MSQDQQLPQRGRCGSLGVFQARLFVVALALTLPLSGNSESTTLLNSDLIRERFGSYFVDILEQDNGLRVANLYSEHDGRRICRTLAVTAFVVPPPPGLARAHGRILAGESIGATLRELGFAMEKSGEVTGTAHAGTAFASLTGGEVAPGSSLALRTYVLSVTSRDGRIDYATIAEAYHPSHVPAATGDPVAIATADDRALKRLLDAL